MQRFRKITVYVCMYVGYMHQNELFQVAFKTQMVKSCFKFYVSNYMFFHPLDIVESESGLDESTYHQSRSIMRLIILSCAQ